MTTTQVQFQCAICKQKIVIKNADFMHNITCSNCGSQIENAAYAYDYAVAPDQTAQVYKKKIKFKPQIETSQPTASFLDASNDDPYSMSQVVYSQTVQPTDHVNERLRREAMKTREASCIDLYGHVLQYQISNGLHVLLQRKECEAALIESVKNKTLAYYFMYVEQLEPVDESSTVSLFNKPLMPWHMLIFVYLGCIACRQSIMLCDLLRMAQQGQFPYRNVWPSLLQEQRQNDPAKYSELLKKTSQSELFKHLIPAQFKSGKLPSMNTMWNFLAKELVAVIPNISSLPTMKCKHIVKNLCERVLYLQDAQHLIDYTCKLIRYFSTHFGEEAVVHPIFWSNSFSLARVHSSATAESAVAMFLVIVLKMMYGWHAHRENNAMPEFSEMIQNMMHNNEQLLQHVPDAQKTMWLKHQTSMKHLQQQPQDHEKLEFVEEMLLGKDSNAQESNVNPMLISLNFGMTPQKIDNARHYVFYKKVDTQNNSEASQYPEQLMFIMESLAHYLMVPVPSLQHVLQRLEHLLKLKKSTFATMDKMIY